MKHTMIGMLALIGGCSSTPSTYEREPWAAITLEQARAECYAAVQANPMLGFPTCMQAKGWQER